MQRTKMLGIATLTLLLTLSACGADTPANNTPLQETTPAVESVLETPEVSTPEPESIVESSLEPAQSDLEPIGEYIPQYTTTDTSEEALIQLVKDTITIDHDRMEAEHITPAEQDTAQLGEWLFVHDETPFIDYKCVNIPYLTYFLSHGLFNADIAELDNWNLSKPAQRQVFNAYFDVSYTLAFDYQDTTYQALIGNWEGEYIVLDMIVEGDIDLTPQPTATPEAPQSNSNSNSASTPEPQTPSGGGSTSYTPAPAPDPTPVPQPDPTPAPATPAPQAPGTGSQGAPVVDPNDPRHGGATTEIGDTGYVAPDAY